MATKIKKNILNKPLSGDTEAVALGSIVSVLIALAIKSIILAIPLGLAFAFAHKHGLKKKGKTKSGKK